MQSTRHTPSRRLPPRWRELWTVLRCWQTEREHARRVRAHLAAMSVYRLRDIGLARFGIEQVAPRPEWQRLVADTTARGRKFGGLGTAAAVWRP